ncbi:hypothetical protein AGMMS49975_28930 [Clostridia bacterium]|nr:hypothetical protein AGMMS49975_28930 [Clostridia bacterium]
MTMKNILQGLIYCVLMFIIIMAFGAMFTYTQIFNFVFEHPVIGGVIAFGIILI